jgi:hypothetical protein
MVRVHLFPIRVGGIAQLGERQTVCGLFRPSVGDGSIRDIWADVGEPQVEPYKLATVTGRVHYCVI